MIKRVTQISFILATVVLIVSTNARQAIAQNPTITVGTVYGTAGNPVDLPLYLAARGAGVVSLQFDLVLPAELVSLDPPLITAGPAALAADKSLWGSILPSGGLRILVFGLNQKAIGDGILATIRLNVTGENIPKTLPVGITGILASDMQAINVPISGTSGAVVTTNRFLWQRAPQQPRQKER